MVKVGNILLVGANRGIGFQLLKEFLDKLNPDRIFATYRTEEQSKELLELAAANNKIRTIKLDAVDDAKFPDVAKQIEKETGEAGLNLLVFNSGMADAFPQNLESITKDVLIRHFEVNAAAPLLMAKAVASLLAKGSAANAGTPKGVSRGAVVNISTIMSSNELWDVTAGAGPVYAYRGSKAALNMFTKSLSVELRDKNVLAVAVHPGWVQTTLGGPGAVMTVKQSADGIVNVLTNLNESQNGLLLNYDGTTLKW